MPFIGNQPALSYTSFAKQDFTTSATTSYTLDQPVANANELALFINFVRQEPTTAYTASGTSLTLTSATSASDDMYCVFLGKAVQTVNPPNGSVGASQIADGSIALGKLSATGTKDSTTFLRGDNTFASAGGDNTPTWYGELGSDSGTQTSGATVKITGMTTDEVDTNTAFDGTTFTVPSGEAGKYFVFGTVSMSTVGGSYTGEASEGHIFVNGSSVIKSRFRNHSNRDIGEDSQQVMGILNLSVGDTVELYGRFANDDWIFTTLDSGNAGTNFGGYKLIGV